MPRKRAAIFGFAAISRPPNWKHKQRPTARASFTDLASLLADMEFVGSFGTDRWVVLLGELCPNSSDGGRGRYDWMWLRGGDWSADRWPRLDHGHIELVEQRSDETSISFAIPWRGEVCCRNPSNDIIIAVARDAGLGEGLGLCLAGCLTLVTSVNLLAEDETRRHDHDYDHENDDCDADDDIDGRAYEVD